MNTLPDLGRWFVKCGEDSQPAVTSAWRAAMQPVELSDAKAGVLAVVSGELVLGDAGGYYDRQFFAADIRRYANEQRSRRLRELDKPEPMRPRAVGAVAWLAMQKYVDQAIAAGVPKDEWVAEGVRLLGEPVGREPRFKCPTCLDTGFVTVWNAAALLALSRGELAAYHGMRTAVAGCVCRIVRKWIPTFDDALFCRLRSPGGRSDEDVAAAEQFMLRQLPAQAEFF